MQSGDREVIGGAFHLILVLAMFFCGLSALVLYFKMTNRLGSVGESVPGLFERKNVLGVLRRYRELAAQHSWPTWLPSGYWTALFLAAVFGFLFVYWR